jgi:AraC-like DNA-binding protein
MLAAPCGGCGESARLAPESTVMANDILSDVLRKIRLRGALYYFVNGGRTWAAEAPPAREISAAVMPGSEHVMEYHLVTGGSCWSAIVGEAPVRLEAGDAILFPQGDPHVLSSAPGMRAAADPAAYFEQRHEPRPFTLHLEAAEGERDGEAPGDGPCGATLVCGFLGCDLRPFNPIIATLPRLMHLRAADGHEGIAQFMRHAVGHSKGARPGGEAMLERMSEMMFIDAIGRYVETLPGDSRGWLAGLRDRFVGRALSLMHEEPAKDWTVDELGRQVGLSRSALHERFAEMIGQPPMQYLANWRIQVGASLLRNSNATVASIAQEVGYESEASFARAFKRMVGKPPATWRRQQ